MEITRIRHRWAEKKGFLLSRPQGRSEYILLHFLTPVDLTFGGEVHRVGLGDLIVFAPGTPHCIHAPEPLLHDWIHLSGGVDALMRAYGLEPDTLYHLSHATAVSDLVAALETEFFAQRPFWPELAQAKLHELFILVARGLSDAPTPLAVRVETVERLREIRDRMLSEPWHTWSIEEMAENAHISQSRLHAVYKSVFGVSPKHDLILMRIEKAKQLLQSGMSVTETSEALGYGTIYHFIRQFKQITGVTPKQYHEWE